MPKRGAALMFLLALGCAAAPRALDVGTVAVDQLDGRAVTLRPLRGHAAVVYLMTTACDPCLADLAKLRALHERHGPRGLKIVLVALDPEGRRLVQPFAENLALPFPVTVAGEATRAGAGPLGRTAAVPRTVVLGPDGAVQLDRDEVVPYAELEAAVERALAGQGQPL